MQLDCGEDFLPDLVLSSDASLPELGSNWKFEQALESADRRERLARDQGRAASAFVAVARGGFAVDQHVGVAADDDSRPAMALQRASDFVADACEPIAVHVGVRIPL